MKPLKFFKLPEYIVVEKVIQHKNNPIYYMNLREWVAMPESERICYIYLYKIADDSLKNRLNILLLPFIEDKYYNLEQELRRGGYLK